MDKYDTSQLTEFPRFEPESTQSGVSTFFNKLWKFPIFATTEATEGQKKSGESNETASERSQADDEAGKPEQGTYAAEFEGRSLPNVLRRISSLVAMGPGNRQESTRYADTELARYWMPDDISRECYECASRFSTLRRRHHCRVCGQIFCSRCCSQRVPGHIFGCTGGLRVCNYCSNVVLSYLKENDLTGDISSDLRTLQENLQVKFPENKSNQLLNKTRDNFMFAREQEDRCEVRSSPREQLQDIFRHLAFSLPTQQHRYRLVRYTGVWRGCDVLQWLMDNTDNKTRAQASQVCQGLLGAGYMECTTDLPQFADYALYRPVVMPPDPAPEDSPEEVQRLVESGSSYCLDLNLGENSARLIKTAKSERKESSSGEDSPVIEHTEAVESSVKTCSVLSAAGAEHLRLLLRHCLHARGLQPAWLPVLLPLCRQAADVIAPDVHSNDIDVRNYVQVKKVPGDSPKDSCLIHGVVLTKNVAHRGMPQQITNPTVLLLDCSIAYQRVEGKLTSLEPVLMQEQEYLSRCCMRLCALQPQVVLVRGGVARGVQERLRTAVSLAAGVRPRALARAARSLRAQPLASIDARVGTPRLGTCRNFYVKHYSSKTLMVLEGCAEPNLGCCILLRGASLQELVRVKKVVKFMLLACYNWKVEKAFLTDIDAILPEPGMTFEDDEAELNDEANNITNDGGNDITKVDDDNDIANLNNNADSKDANNSESPKNDSVGSDIIFDGTSAKSSTRDVGTGNDDENNDTKDVSYVKNVEVIKETSDATNSDNAENNDVKVDEDPLQKTKYVRKTDSEKNLSCGVPIRDFSDPLRSTLSVDDEVFLPKEEAKLKADTHTDRWCSDDAVLSMSPNVVIPAPYLETEAGRKCPLRRYFPSPLLPAVTKPPHTPHTPRAYHRKISKPQQDDVVVKEVHPFIKNPITAMADDPAVKASLAHYRATGGRLLGDKHKPWCALHQPSVVKKPAREAGDQQSDSSEPLDPMAPENHQQLSLLLYSYSNKSPNAPDFCVNPWIVTMEMYGRHDISLGAFLDKYCFNPEYKCTSSTCHVPMNHHVRRFVHGDVCITITCNTIGHSNVDKVKDQPNKQVMFWSRCGRCGAAGRARRVGRAALGLSLAQYVWLRAAPPRARPLRARTCTHALHAHTHAFVCGLTTACFRFNKITHCEIQLPPDMISINYDTKQMRDALISQLNELMLKGHETFSLLPEGEAQKEAQAFRGHMEHVHLALSTASLHHQTSLAAVVRSLWGVSDRVLSCEKMLRDAQERWTTPRARTAADNIVEDKPELEDSTGDGTDGSGTTYVFATDAGKESDKEHPGTEEDEEKGDKKSARQILSQLLSNNQPANQGGTIMSGGVIPVAVSAGEAGSVLAATLASATYRTALRHSTQAEQEDNENGKEKSDGDKVKAAKSSDHIEVLLKDGLVCRVYYAAQFQKLRHMLISPLSCNPHITDSYSATGATKCDAEAKCCCEEAKERGDKGLCDIEEGFIRSLAQSVPWAAKGGKSGSTFCKTKDDRYVLKDMTKPEWQQFLEFAPHYFNYVVSCKENNQPSLLARIVGVYSVGGSRGVLVTEHVWYAGGGGTGTGGGMARFDLKGTSRPRRATPAPHAVLLDDNLLHLRWERQLYIRSHAGSVLWSAVQRDTDFLCAHGVMDYSLLLGIDDRTLVVGIIDYIRTFTWDKKLEHLMKNLGSGQPTVVSPEQYRQRFQAACRKYFLQCPEHWDHLHTILHA